MTALIQRLTLAGLAALLAVAAAAQTSPRPSVQLVPNDRSVRVDRFEPADGPLERFTSRPGAWYATVFVALQAQFPVELMVMQPNPSHELKLLALETDVTGEVLREHALPLSYVAPRRGAPAQYFADFVLPEPSPVGGLVVVLEQWSRTGYRPAPVWVRVGPAGRHPRASTTEPWWGPSQPKSAASRPVFKDVTPASPLLSQGRRKSQEAHPPSEIPPSPILDPHSAR